MTTYSPKLKEIKRTWHEIDLKGEVLGRVSSKIANLLMGKGKPYFSYHLDCGDYVVAKNAKYIKLTGKKTEQKVYRSHSGYPGGAKQIVLEKLMQKNPAKVVENAVKGMLPNNKLRASMLKRLYIYPSEEHPYKKMFEN